MVVIPASVGKVDIDMARGRKRKPGPREPNGRVQRQPKDKGTDRIQQIRAWFIQHGNPDEGSYPLGILCQNGAINEEQRKAGCEYARLYAIVHGRISLAAAAFERQSQGYDGDWDNEWLEARHSRLRAIQAVLGHYPRRYKTVLDNVAVFERPPRFMLPVFPRMSDIKEAQILSEVLNILAGVRLDKAA